MSAGVNVTPMPDELTGCACRWNADDVRVMTCERHKGWLDVVSEWADRAKAAEANVDALQTQAYIEGRRDQTEEIPVQIHSLLWEPQPTCCGQPCEGGSYMGASEEVCCGNPDYDSLGDQELVRRLRLLIPQGSVASETDPIPF